MKLENLKPEKSTLTGSARSYVLDYGTIEQSSNGDLEVKLISDEKLESVRAGVSCMSCTNASAKKINDNEAIISINYKTSILGNINKSVYIYYVLEGSSKTAERVAINIIGKVIK